MFGETSVNVGLLSGCRYSRFTRENFTKLSPPHAISATVHMETKGRHRDRLLLSDLAGDERT
jgi:hypothetical protein